MSSFMFWSKLFNLDEAQFIDFSFPFWIVFLVSDISKNSSPNPDIKDGAGESIFLQRVYVMEYLGSIGLFRILFL